jgi:hypothetical protein
MPTPPYNAPTPPRTSGQTGQLTDLNAVFGQVASLTATAQAAVSFLNPVLRTASATLTSADMGSSQVFTGTGSLTLTLPALSAAQYGQLISIRVAPTSTVSHTLAAAGSDLIDGIASQLLQKGEFTVLLGDASGWVKVGGSTLALSAAIAGHTTAISANTTAITANATAITTTSTADRARANHTGTQSADTIVDGTTNKAYAATEKTKLAGIATGATAYTDTQAVAANAGAIASGSAADRTRANHTGTQAAATITGLATVATSGSYADLLNKPAAGGATTDASQLTTGILALARLDPSVVLLNAGKTVPATSLPTFNALTTIVTTTSDAAGNLTQADNPAGLLAAFKTLLASLPGYQANNTVSFRGDFTWSAISGANAAPVASNALLTGAAGAPMVGKVYGFSYTYSDFENDAAGTPIVKFYVADDATGLNKTLMATAATYTVVSASVGKRLLVGVTPVAATGTSPGSEVFSAYSAAIVPASTSTVLAFGPGTVDTSISTGYQGAYQAQAGKTASTNFIAVIGGKSLKLSNTFAPLTYFFYTVADENQGQIAGSGGNMGSSDPLLVIPATANFMRISINTTDYTAAVLTQS